MRFQHPAQPSISSQVLSFQFGTDDTLCSWHHHHFLYVVTAPLYGSLETCVLLIGANCEDVEIYFLYIFINIFVNLNLVNVAYGFKHEAFPFKRIYYTRFGFIFEDSFIVLNTDHYRPIINHHIISKFIKQYYVTNVEQFKYSKS